MREREDGDGDDRRARTDVILPWKPTISHVFHFFTPHGFEAEGIRTPGRQKPDGGAGEDPKGGRLFCHEGLGILEVHWREREMEKPGRQGPHGQKSGEGEEGKGYANATGDATLI